MSFPFLFLALSLVLGILFSSFMPLFLSFSLTALVISLCSAWILYLLRKDTLSLIFILITTFLFGSTLFTFQNKKFEENPLHNMKHAGYADFYGKIYKSPSRGHDKDHLFLKVEKVSYQNKEEKIKGNLRVTVPYSSEFPSKLNIFIHDKIKVSARLLPQKGFRNFKNSSLDMYLKTQNIHNRASTKSPLLVEKIEDGKKYFPLRLLSCIRQKLQQKIEEHFSSSEGDSLSPQGGVLEALLLGERGRIPLSITRSLQKAGLYHLFAISGAHIAIISFLLFSVFRLLRVPTRTSFLLLIFFLVFYAFLVEGRPSVVRATIMTLAFLFGKLIWRDVNLINTISMSAFILLLINPLSLFSLGFELTFAASFSIILFFPKIIKCLPRLPLRTSEIFAVSLTAQLGVLPFVVSSFNRVTFSSLILNFAALPLLGLIMASGYIFLPLSFVSPSLAQPLAKGIKFLINLLTNSSHLFDSLSFISYRIPTPHLFTIIGYFLFLYLLLLPPRIKRQNLIGLLCFLLFVAVLISYPFPSISRNLKLTFIDVGQGDSILAEFPGKKKMLIDGGGIPVGTFDIGESVVSPFLWDKGIKKIDYLILTHAHPDHINGLKAIARNFKIGEYWESLIPLNSEPYAEFQKSIPPSVPQKRFFRHHTHLEGDVRIEVLHPQQGNPYVQTVHNDQSLVLRITYGQTSFLLTGDIGINAEREILENVDEIKCQVLKSPHHGSKFSSSIPFLQRIAPRIVVISVGEGNIYGLPDQKVLEKYREIGAKIYRIDLHGAVEISSDGKRISIRTASGSSE